MASGSPHVKTRGDKRVENRIRQRQVASLSTSLEYCHASIVELKTENESLRSQVTIISRDTDERRRQAASDHDAVVQLLEWRSMRDNILLYGIDERQHENWDAVLAPFFTGERGVSDHIVLARDHRMHSVSKSPPHGQNHAREDVSDIGSAKRYGWLH